MLLLALLLACPTAPLTPAPAGSPTDPFAAPLVVPGLGQEPEKTDHKEEFARRRKEAGNDVAKLWELFDWCDAYGLATEGRAVLRAIVRVEPGNSKARELLGDIFHDGRWFTSEKALEEYKAKALVEEARRTGKVIHKGTLVDKADLPYLQKGLVRDEFGRWIDPADAQRLAEGWVRQDLEWISPEEREKLDKGLWKCGEQWLSEAEADEYHAAVERCWQIPGEGFVLYTTLPRKTAQRAHAEVVRALEQCARLLGPMPEGPVAVLVLRSIDQYNTFAGEGGPVELRSLSSCHGAFLAEVWAEPLGRGMPPAGVAYWDFTTDAGNRFGPTFARHAAGLSYVEHLDGSPKALERLRAGQTNGLAQAFWSEKLVPEWVRNGVAAYAGRYMLDSVGGGDPSWLRKWSVSNIGSLDPLAAIFAFRASVEDCLQTSRLMNQSGLLMAFAIDGNAPEVKGKLDELRQAVQARHPKAIQQAARDLQASIHKHEAALRAFAGI